MVYDPGNKKVLIFGGWGGNYGGVGFFPNNVAQFDAHTGDVCLSEGSDAAHGLYNSTRGGACSLPARSGTPPALTRMDGTSNIRLKWPAWTWVSDLSKAAYYGGEDSYEQGGIFLYDPTGNAWSKSTKGGGPTLDEAGGLSQQGWAYSESDQKFVWTSFGTSYQVQQLPLAAITGVTGTQRLSLTISGTGSATDGATFTCSTGTCTHDYNAGSRIILTATGTSGYTFAGWTGDCSGTGTCTLTMSADKSATAVFDPPAAANATKYSGMTITGVKIQ
jgi:uncharacterized repeat protein (TIGR02543 family)